MSPCLATFSLIKKISIAENICHPSTQESGMGGLLWLQGLPVPHSETLSQTYPQERIKGSHIRRKGTLNCFRLLLILCPLSVSICLTIHLESIAITLFFFKKITYFEYMSGWYLHLSMCAFVPEEGVRHHYRWLWATVWVLRIELRKSFWKSRQHS